MPEGQEEHPIKVSESSKEYKDSQELGSSIQDPLDYAFGYMIYSTRKKMSIIPKVLRPKFEQTHTKHIGEAREHLVELTRNPRSIKYLLDFTRSSISNKHVGLLPHILTGSDKWNFNKIFDVENLPDEVLEEMIIAHIDRFQEGLSYLNKESDTWKTQFQRRVSEKITDGEYPLSNETLNRRLQQTKVVLGDALRDDLTSDRGGQFDVDLQTAMIAQQEVKKRGEKIYTHELFHALSGRTLIARKEHDQDSEYDGITINAQRVGLRFQAGNTARFHWLNEAVTESLAQDLLHNEPESTYKEERELYQLLQTKGKSPIDHKLFLGAYFENYDPNIPHDERIPEWKTLYRTINDSYSTGFLVRLDDFIKTNGVGKAISVMKNDWTEISNVKSDGNSTHTDPTQNI